MKVLANADLKKIQGLSLLELLATDHLANTKNLASENLLLSKVCFNQ